MKPKGKGTNVMKKMLILAVLLVASARAERFLPQKMNTFINKGALHLFIKPLGYISTLFIRLSHFTKRISESIDCSVSKIDFKIVDNENSRPEENFFHKVIYSTGGMLIGGITYCKDTHRFWTNDNTVDPRNNFYIASLRIADTYQKNGFGTKLLQYAINDIINRGGHSITLLGVTNPGGHRMYQKAGFCKINPSDDENRSVQYIYIVPEKQKKETKKEELI
jgi:ribosomal protein S18 acetylase RimI-like enzyme